MPITPTLSHRRLPAIPPPVCRLSAQPVSSHRGLYRTFGQTQEMFDRFVKCQRFVFFRPQPKIAVSASTIRSRGSRFANRSIFPRGMAVGEHEIDRASCRDRWRAFLLPSSFGRGALFLPSPLGRKALFLPLPLGERPSFSPSPLGEGAGVRAVIQH